LITTLINKSIFDLEHIT